MRKQLGAAARAAKRVTRLAMPTHCSVVVRDLFGIGGSIHTDDTHLKAVMDWLCRAQDASGSGGVSGVYTLYDGWHPPYPETTGYIIPTFLEYAALTGNAEYSERALRMGDWEIDVQLPDGAIRGGMGLNEYPLVFNTGQVIFGWMALYRETGSDRFLDAARRAADWLVACQDEDGKWSRHSYQGAPHTYHTRVAWSLLEVYRTTGSEDYERAAGKHVAWALAQATETGWFRNAAFTAADLPWTHTIAYTLTGLLEASRVLGGEVAHRALDVVQLAAERIMTTYEMGAKDPDSMPAYLPATLDENWRSQDKFSCITGDAQIGSLWLRLYRTNRNARFLKSARKIIDHVKMTQRLDSKNPGIRGGVPGSRPIWGAYAPFRYPNWAAKFLADAIMLQKSTTKEVEETSA